MKGSAVVIDQSLQLNKPLPSLQPPSTQELFPTRLALDHSAQSYSTVVEQAIITQDKPLLKEILVDCEVRLIQNTVAEINVGKVSRFLSMLEEYLYLDSQHSERYCLWIEEIVKRHIGIVLSNLQNRDVIARIRKYLQKRTNERANLINIKNKLKIKEPSQKTKDFVPKFSYMETKGQKMEEEQKIVLGDDFDFEDEMLDQFEE